MTGVDGISVPDDLKEFTDFGGDIDLTSSAQSACARPARMIDVLDGGSGNLSVLMIVNANGAPRALTTATGKRIEGKFLKILASGTDVTKVRVGW